MAVRMTLDISRVIIDTILFFKIAIAKHQVLVHSNSFRISRNWETGAASLHRTQISMRARDGNARKQEPRRTNEKINGTVQGATLTINCHNLMRESVYYICRNITNLRTTTELTNHTITKHKKRDHKDTCTSQS